MNALYRNTLSKSAFSRSSLHVYYFSNFRLLWLASLAFLKRRPARLIDKERFLLGNLPGYSDYCQKVRHHIMPYVW